MLIHDDIFNWSGWGGKLSLGSGKCRLRIFDLQKEKTGGPIPIRHMIILVSDVQDSKASVKSCCCSGTRGIYKISPNR